MKIKIEEVSGKISEAFPKDPEADLSSGNWAGNVIFTTVATPVPSPELDPSIKLPSYVPDGDLNRRI